MTPTAVALRLARWASVAGLERAARDPAGAQGRFLRSLVRAQRHTVFGRAHDFAAIGSLDDFRRLVPLHEYEDLRPWVERMAEGEPAVLTAEAPTMFATTSGTTAEPKLVPVTPSWLRHQEAMTRCWTVAALADHPLALGGRTLTLASPAVEGWTPGGVPLGSMSGLMEAGAPGLVRRRRAVPEELALVVDHDERSFAIMRLALTRAVAAVATPNATSLLRLAEVAASRGEEIVRAVHDGVLGVPAAALPPGARARLHAGLRPDPSGARSLARVIEAHGRLLPAACWPRLELIGCWLGGIAGVHARRLGPCYGDQVARRDLGLLATEGRITLPLADGDPAGVLALGSTFFELIAERDAAMAHPPTLLPHEVEDGGRYEVVLTGANGLYRYRMHDIVEVQGFHHRTPRLAFLGKGADMVSVTGEKVHVDQAQAALDEAAGAAGLDVWQFRLVADVDGCGHDLLVELRGAMPDPRRAGELAARFDEALATTNCEYAAKRASRRLRPPRLFVMAPGWSEGRCRAAFAAGRREHQHKWTAVAGTWDELDREAVVLAVTGAGEADGQPTVTVTESSPLL